MSSNVMGNLKLNLPNIKTYTGKIRMLLKRIRQRQFCYNLLAQFILAVDQNLQEIATKASI